MRDNVESAAPPQARCRNSLRGSFIAILHELARLLAGEEGVTSQCGFIFEVLPAAGTTAAFDFTERRHVPVTAQHKRYANCPVLNSGVVPLLTQSGHERLLMLLR